MAVEKPAIEGGRPVREKPLAPAAHWVGQSEIDAVADVLRTGWLAGGPKIAEFERAFGGAVGAPHAVAVNSGTAALHLSVLASDIGPGDEVITTPLTFIATTFAILYAGATPVFADVREDTFNIDPADIGRRITPRTKAILPVHYAGNPADLDPILALARKYNLKVIEDAAQAAGAEYRGRRIGTHSDLVCFSFQATKNITCGEGGMVTTADAAAAERLRSLRFFGIPADAHMRSLTPTPWRYEVEELGFKYNTTDIQAALGLAQLARLGEFNAARERYFDLYSELFSDAPEIITPVVTDGAKSAYHLYVVRIREGALKVDRDRFLAALRAENVLANVHYTPVYRHPYCARALRADPAEFPVCERVAGTCVSLPLYPKLSEADIHSVVEAVGKIVNFYRK